MHLREELTGLIMALGAFTASPAMSQQVRDPSLPPGASLPAYADRHAEVMGLAGDPARVGDVHDLVLSRDAGRFTLTSGKLYLLTPVGGRSVAAMFRGQGLFSFAPPTPIEQDRLARFEKTRSLEEGVLAEVKMEDWRD